MLEADAPCVCARSVLSVIAIEERVLVGDVCDVCWMGILLVFCGSMLVVFEVAWDGRAGSRIGLKWVLYKIFFYITRIFCCME